MVALHPQKVPGSCVFAFLTIVTGNVDHASQLGRYRLHGDTCRHGIPSGHHPFARFRCLFANGTATVMHSELSEAVPVNRVSTGHLVRCATGTKQVLLTDRAVATVLARFAIVAFVEALVDAHATFVAMLEVFFAPDAAKTTVRAVVGCFFVGHPQIANVAMVGTKFHTAGDAVVGFAGLPGKAVSTNGLSDGKAVDRVTLVVRRADFHACKATRQRRTAMEFLSAIVDLWW